MKPDADSERTAIEWSVSPDAGEAHAQSWKLLLLPLIREWTESLDRALAQGGACRLK